MPAGQMMELAKSGAFADFEARCLELLEAGELSLAQLVPAFQHLQREQQAGQLATLTQMIFENVDPNTEPEAALKLARIALVASPKDETLRDRTVELYRKLYGDQPGFDLVLESSGIQGGRPMRMALKMLDVCLTLKAGDVLISRMDDHVVEVQNVDRDNGLFVLRKSGRVTTRPAPEVLREYDRIAADDFRVLRALRADRLLELIEKDPVAVVIGLIHAHGEHVDADVLKHELVPRYIDPKDWSSWWTKARTRLKRSPHVTIEGRSPMILTYTDAARTLEEETWDAVSGSRNAADWVSTMEGYLREKSSRSEKPDAGLLQKFQEHTLAYIAAIRQLREAEALECALALERLAQKGLPVDETTLTLPVEMMRDTRNPVRLLRDLEQDSLRERAFADMRKARPDDWVEHALAFLPEAPAALYDSLVGALFEAERGDAVQAYVDAGLNDLPQHAELVYWLWKGPRDAAKLRLPSDFELFRMILDTLSSAGRTVAMAPEIVKNFRHRVKAALGLRGFSRVKAALTQTPEAAAITMRQQILRLEGLGANTPAKLSELLRDVHPQLWVVRRREVMPWEDKETVWCTQQGAERRVSERDELVNVKMHENAKRIGEAASHGDLSENSEYKFALEERDFLRAQLAKLNDELSRARTFGPQDVPDDRVGIGTRVRLRDVADGQERVMTFMGPFETDVDRGMFSYQAPFAQSVMGKRVGDHVKVPMDGREMEFEVASIENGFTPPNE